MYMSMTCVVYFELLSQLVIKLNFDLVICSELVALDGAGASTSK